MKRTYEIIVKDIDEVRYRIVDILDVTLAWTIFDHEAEIYKGWNMVIELHKIAASHDGGFDSLIASKIT